jgi:hypothetical protein
MAEDAGAADNPKLEIIKIPLENKEIVGYLRMPKKIPPGLRRSFMSTKNSAEIRLVTLARKYQVVLETMVSKWRSGLRLSPAPPVVGDDRDLGIGQQGRVCVPKIISGFIEW